MTNVEKTQISLRLPLEIVSKFDRIAEILERDRTWVMHRAMTQFLAAEGAEIIEDAEGLSDLDEGRKVDIGDVLEKARHIVDAAENRLVKKAR